MTPKNCHLNKSRDKTKGIYFIRTTINLMKAVKIVGKYKLNTFLSDKNFLLQFEEVGYKKKEVSFNKGTFLFFDFFPEEFEKK